MCWQDKAAAIIQKWEGIRLNAYKCPAGVWTIGYGQTGPGIVYGTRWTLAQAKDALAIEIAVRGRGVDAAVTVPLTVGQKAALVSLVYNIGIGAFLRSTLLRMLNMKSYKGAAGQFARWNKGGGSEMIGLTNRRADERALFVSDGPA